MERTKVIDADDQDLFQVRLNDQLLEAVVIADADKGFVVLPDGERKEGHVSILFNGNTVHSIYPAVS